MNEKDFLSTLTATLSDPAVKRDLKTISDQGTSALAQKMVDTRESILEIPSRIELDQYLEQRLSRYTDAPSTSRVPRLASMYVTDASGTIFAIAYDNPVAREQNSTGRNYAYRTYYHGGKNDLPKDTPIRSIEPLKSMHLSAAFQSTATGLWKVAISAPIRLPGNEASARPDAVFVATINLGDFELLQGDAGANQVAVLVDARDGPTRGTVLQHPYLELRHETGKQTSGDVYKVDADMMNVLLRGGDDDYLDPIANAQEAEAYAGTWIAAMQPVSVPGEATFDSDNENHADLLVLVQYRLRKVFAPVGAMQQSLLQEGAIALALILLVSGTLWLIVRRVGDDWAVRKRRQLAAAANGSDGDRASAEPAESPLERASSDTSKPSPPPNMTETLES
jgi:hypothetical protein